MHDLCKFPNKTFYLFLHNLWTFLWERKKSHKIKFINSYFSSCRAERIKRSKTKKTESDTSWGRRRGKQKLILTYNIRSWSNGIIKNIVNVRKVVNYMQIVWLFKDIKTLWIFGWLQSFFFLLAFLPHYNFPCLFFLARFLVKVIFSLHSIFFYVYISS